MSREFLLPDIGEGLVEAEIVEWLVAEGAMVGSDDPLVEVETDKTVVVIPSPVAGVVTRHGAGAGETLAVGAILAVIDDGTEHAAEEIVTEEDPPLVGTFGTQTSVLPARSAPGATVSAKVTALPLVRKLAREHNVDLTQVVGSGPDGRITRSDVMALTGDVTTQTSVAPPTPAVMTKPSFEGSEVVAMSKMRKTIASRMSESWAHVPRVTTFDDVDATRLLSAKKALQARYGRAVPLEALVVQAVIPVLGEFREFNATVDGTNLVLHNRMDIAIAVDTPAGLMVPVLRNAHALTVLESADQIARLSAGAIERSLESADMSDATFTVSNIGAVGGGHGTPIVPPGTTAILSVGRAKDSAVVRNGEVVIAPMMPLSLSYDHRAIDGALGRAFMGRLIENLVEPALFLA